MNESFNGFLGRYVPKVNPMKSSDEEIKMTENRLDNLTRKSLGFRTPVECFINRHPLLHFVLKSSTRLQTMCRKQAL